MPSISLPVASSRHRSPPASTSRLVNAMAEALAPDAKTPLVLTRAPGVSSWLTCGTGPIEGLHADHGLLYAVSGGGFYSITSTPTATLRGAVGSSTEIDMDSNESAVVIVSPPNAYHYTPATTTFAAISDVDFTARGAGDVEFLDNYMLFREPDTARFFGADLGSVSAFNSLMFATAEGGPDTLVGMKVDHRNAILFGEKSVELWENTGASGFPFERMVNGFVEIGCANGKTVAKGDNSVWWVADDYTVRRLEGITPVRVSDHTVEQWLRSVTLVSLRGYFYSLEGHLCYVLRATEGCFVFDVTTQLWTERATYGEPSWNWANPVRFAGKVLVGSTDSNVIGELDPEYYYELGETLRMEWTYQPVYNDGARAFHDRIELIMETGVGLTSGQGSAPEVMLSFSDDGGRTWFNLPNRTLGPIGNYQHRVFWAGLGSCASQHGRVYRAAVSDPVRVAIVDTILSVRSGRL
jgi:hypothetical protein